MNNCPPDWKSPAQQAAPSAAPRLELTPARAQPPEPANLPANIDVNQLLAALNQAAANAPAPVIPIADLVRIGEDWLYDLRHSRGRSHRTIGDYAESFKRLLAHLQWLGVDGCGDAEMREYFGNMLAESPAPGREMPRGSRSRQKQYANLRACFNWALQRRYIVRSPLEHVPPPFHRPAVIEPFTGQHVLRLLAAAKESDNADRDFALLLVMFDTGLRAEEVCALTRADFNYERRTLHVRHGKGDKPRVAIVSPLTATQLWNYLRLGRRADDSPIFRSQRGGGSHLNRDSLAAIFDRLGKKAGIDDVRCSPHTMRHAFASSYMMAGGKVEDLQRLLGHSKPEMAMHYATLSTEHLTKEHMRNSPVSALFDKKRREG